MGYVGAWGYFSLFIEAQWIAGLGNVSRIVRICIIRSEIHKNQTMSVCHKIYGPRLSG